MPILHAEWGDTEIHCAWVHEHDDTTSEHSMNMCLEIVKEIQSYTSFDKWDTEPIFVITAFQKFFEIIIWTRIALSEIDHHATDPPFLKAHNLVGIVKIIS